VVVDLERDGTAEQYRCMLRLEVLALDGGDPVLAVNDQLVDEPAALRAVIDARNPVYTMLLQSMRFACACT
jgi:hypothetical protein